MMLSGARGRLLPVSVPFRFFAAAACFHVLAWAALFMGAADAARFQGGLGWPLAALHLVTLGVLAMTAMGASLQLMPVATRQPVYSERGPAVLFWLYTPGVAAVALGMGLSWTRLLAVGAGLVALALAGFGVLLGRNLVGARGMPGVVAHGWVAIVSLFVTIVTALSLALAYTGWPLFDRGAALALHVTFAAYGFMGMLSLGLSYILVPMFALAHAPKERWVLASCALAAAALGLTATAALGVVPRFARLAALALAFAAAGVHLRLMAQARRRGMRRELGRSFKLVHWAWGFLVGSLAAALALELDAPVPGLATIFGILLIPGWLLTFLLGMLQRIAPFLASMHAVAGPGRPPSPSMLTDDRPLRLHYTCHLVALALLLAAALAGSGLHVAVAASVGTAGALAYAAFLAILGRRVAGRLGEPARLA
ncbi:MAG: hypothetical protein IT518_17835 [Burkholderiales bacterium]|nr:hypothetical protein [Burkholderiales bacterium]